MGGVGDAISGAISGATDAVSHAVGEITGANAAERAGKQQAEYLEKSAEIAAGSAEEAKADIIARMVPAMSDYMSGISQAQTQIAEGTTDVMKILQEYTGNADQLLEQGGADAQKAIMGSAAVASGMPVQQFNQAYTAAQNAPPNAQNVMMNNLAQATGSAPSGVQQGATPAQPPTGTSPSGGAGGLTGQAAGGLAGQAAGGLAGQATPSIGSTGTGFYGAAQDIQSGYSTAQNALTSSTAAARQDVTGSTQSALAQLQQAQQTGLEAYQPYSEAGQAAIEKEAALSGAYGAEAQQQAIDAYIESPGQAYLREQQEKALLRSQAAIGGLGGANVRTALQEQAMNIASTQQQQYLSNLRSLATRGQEVAGAESSLAQTTGLASAQLTSDAGNTLAQLAQQYGISSADLAQASSSELASLANQTGLSVASLQQATSEARAAQQTGLGSSLANAAAAGSSDIAGLTS